MEINNINLNQANLIQIKEGGKIYYPNRHTLSKFLLKSTYRFHTSNKYKNYVKSFEIDFGINDGGIQNCYCMSNEGWIEYTNNAIFGKMDDIQKQRHNDFCDLIGSNYRYMCKYNKEELYDEYIQDCINDYKLNNLEYDNLECVHCGRVMPKDIKFFTMDARNKNGYTNVCKICKGDTLFNKDSQARKVYQLFGENGYIAYRDNLLDFYINYVHDNNLKFALSIKDKPYILLEVIKHYYDNSKLKADDLNLNKRKNEFKFIFNTGINTKIINEYCTNNDCKLRPYKYSSYQIGNIDYVQANNILKQYIMDNNIAINDVLKYKEYGLLLRKSRLTQFNDNLLMFVVQFYNYEYAGYKFSIPSSNYYKDVNMRIFDMKWLIENDLKVPIHKIPLYVTRYSLHQKATSLYNTINKYYDSLFEWVNECYPNEFNINDFEINPYRAEFDSLEEAQVDDVLRQNINNVIYNGRNNKNTININGMVPDWLVFTNNNCYLVEYFGLHTDGSVDSSHRLQRYRCKEKIKKDKYNDMDGYEHLFIYPNDLKNNYEGLKNKILKIA